LEGSIGRARQLDRNALDLTWRNVCTPKRHPTRPGERRSPSDRSQPLGSSFSRDRHFLPVDHSRRVDSLGGLSLKFGGPFESLCSAPAPSKSVGSTPILVGTTIPCAGPRIVELTPECSSKSQTRVNTSNDNGPKTSSYVRPGQFIMRLSTRSAAAAETETEKRPLKGPLPATSLALPSAPGAHVAVQITTILANIPPVRAPILAIMIQIAHILPTVLLVCA
jgi:hypothetical protein